MKKIFDTILPGIIAGIFSFAGIYFATVYTQSKNFQNKRLEALLEIDKNSFEKKQKFYRSYLEFSEMCLQIRSYNATDFLEKMQLPNIAADTILKKEWTEKRDELTKLKDSIDYRVYFAFESILQLYDNNPFPDLSHVEPIANSHWYKDKLCEKWISNAAYLKYLINRKLNLEIDESYY